VPVTDERAINQAAEFLDDPQGIRAVLDAIDRLADDPRPAGSFPYGSPDLQRLRIGRYRVLYEITEETVAVRHIARGTATGDPAPGRRSARRPLVRAHAGCLKTLVSVRVAADECEKCVYAGLVRPSPRMRPACRLTLRRSSPMVR
jgi:mRNA interferase RelE/StbE